MDIPLSQAISLEQMSAAVTWKSLNMGKQLKSNPWRFHHAYSSLMIGIIAASSVLSRSFAQQKAVGYINETILRDLT